MSRQSGRRPAAFIVLAAIPLFTLPVLACLDVAVSPGSPLEWLFEFPFHSARPERGAVPTRVRSPGATPGRTQVLRPRGTERVATVPRIGGAMAFARIITSDIVSHLPWVTYRPERFRQRNWSEAAEVGLPAAYPPVPGEETHWFAMGAVLRQLLHPQRVSTLETRALLFRMGLAARLPLDHVEGVGAEAGATIHSVKEDMPALPDQLPGLPDWRRDGSLPGLAERLALIELSTSLAYGLEAPFAPRSRSLGNEAVPVFVKLLNHPHPLVRQNAVLLVSAFDHPDAAGALLSVAVKAKDRVCQARALHALGDWRSAEAVKTLAGLVHHRVVGIIAIESLGRIGGAEAAEAIRRALSGDSTPDVLFTAVPALGRCGDPHPENLKLLERIRSFSRKPEPAPEPPPRGPRRGGPALGVFTPDQPDPPGLKGRILHQSATIALARLGQPAAVEEVLGWKVVGKAGEPVGVLNRISQDLIPPVLGPCTYQYVEALAQLGHLGTAALASVFSDIDVDPYVRLRALLEYPKAKEASASVLATFLKTASSTVLRAGALQALDELDGAAARQAALEVLAGFADGRALDHNEGAEGAEVVAALRILAPHGGIDFALLDSCLAKAKILRSMAERDRRRPRPPPDTSPDGLLMKTEIAEVPDLIPGLLLELGRTGDSRAIPALIGHLRGTSFEAAAAAALSLGAIGGREAAEALVKALSSGDGWIRHCSFRALQALRKDAPFQDWIFAPLAERRKWLAGWESWAADYRPAVAAAPPDPARLPAEKEAKDQEAAEKIIGPAELVDRLLAAWEKEDALESRRLRAAIAQRGQESLPALIAALNRAVVPTVVFDLLEEIVAERLGLDRRRWLEWWRVRKG